MPWARPYNPLPKPRSAHPGSEPASRTVKGVLMMRRQRAATLVEVLVVIVVFLVGILAVVQVFPSGLSVLRTTRNNTIATSLARAEVQRLAGQSEQVAEFVAPVAYQQVAGGLRFVVDPNRTVRDLMPSKDPDPAPGRIDSTGVVQLASGPVGDWMRVSGANLVNRVIGESRPVPSPTRLGNGTIGSLLQLQFAPVFYEPGPGVVLLYGNDYQRRWGNREFGTPNPAAPAQRGRFFLVPSDDSASGDPFSGDDTVWVGPATPQRLRISFSFEHQGGGRHNQYDMIALLELNPASPPAYAAVAGNYWVISFRELVGQPDLFGRTLYSANDFRNVVGGSVRVQRVFDEIPFASPFDPTNPFQYKMWSPNAGTILVNPAGFATRVLSDEGPREPLRVTADYTVFDWRIIRDEFRVPMDRPFTRKLILSSLKVLGNPGPDGRPNPGLGLAIPAVSTGPVTMGEGSDFALVDPESGGFLLGNRPGAPGNGFRVDKSVGSVEFLDVDNDPTNGLSAYYAFPSATQGQWDVVFVPDIRGRNLRALYMAVGEWSIQMFKAADRYRVTQWLAANGLQMGECYVGGSSMDGGNPVGRPDRLYFPLADLGQKVIVNEMWVNDGAGTRLVADQEFLIAGVERVGPRSMAFVDITQRAGPGAVFDFTNGYAVRGVRGASLKVRVMWNPAFFSFVQDEVENYSRVEQWMRNWRRTETETFLEGRN